MKNDIFFFINCILQIVLGKAGLGSDSTVKKIEDKRKKHFLCKQTVFADMYRFKNQQYSNLTTMQV